MLLWATVHGWAEKTGSEAANWTTPYGIEGMIGDTQGRLHGDGGSEQGTLRDHRRGFNREWPSFVNRRLKEDVAVPQQLAVLYRVYARFFQNACSQYQSGLEQMAKLGQSIAENAFQGLQSRTEEKTKR